MTSSTNSNTIYPGHYFKHTSMLEVRLIIKETAHGYRGEWIRNMVMDSENMQPLVLLKIQGIGHKSPSVQTYISPRILYILNGGNARTVEKAGKQRSPVEYGDVDALMILVVGLFQEKQIWLPCIQNWQVNGTMKEMILYDLNTLLNVLVERYGGNANYAAKAGCLKYE